MPSFQFNTLIFILLLSFTLASSITRRNLALDEDEKPTKKKVAQDHELLKPPSKKMILEQQQQQQQVLPIKPTKKSNSTKLSQPKKPSNSTNLTKPKKSNSTNSINLTNPKKFNSTIIAKSLAKTKNSNTTKTLKNSNSTNTKPQQSPPSKKPTKIETIEDTTNSWFDSDDTAFISDDLLADFRDLPSRIIPDLSRLSTTSKLYISNANRQLTKNVKPYVGHKYAASIAAVASTALIIIPLLLLSFVFNRVKTFLTLDKLLIFIQAYLAIYFATLAMIALITGLEPLRFFAAASPPSYAVVQAMQTFGYLIYLVLQMVNVTTGGEGRWLGIAQMMLGVAVGVHYYTAVFHRAVAGEMPRANWRVHGVYAACFVVICACARAERRKKAYIAGDGDDGKKS